MWVGIVESDSVADTDKHCHDKAWAGDIAHC